MALVALKWQADDEDERREAGAPPTRWPRQVLQVGFLGILFVVGVVLLVLWYLLPTLFV